MASNVIDGDLRVSGTIFGTMAGQERSTLLNQNANVVFPIPWTQLRVWDAFATLLPATAAADDLGLYGGTFGTNPPMVKAGDCKALGATSRYARTQVIVPECYESGQTVQIVITAGMVTTVADASCVVDVECYRLDKISGISSDLCATAAQSINSLTFAAKTFAITPSLLVAGDVLDIRITITCTDAATATAVTPVIAGLDATFDIRG